MEKSIDKNTKDMKPDSVGHDGGHTTGADSGGDKKETTAHGSERSAAQDAAAAEPTTAEKEQMVDPDMEIARLEQELARTRDAMLRKAAEFENLKRRTQKEKLQLFEESRANAISRFLPIREDLLRSVQATEGKEQEQGIAAGLKLVLSKFECVLQDYGVEPIEQTGVPFDVDMHDAMLIQPASDDSTESNTVLQVIEPGYKIGERIIKHAKVIVSQ